MTTEDRRGFWTRRLDSGREFMRASSQVPVEECGERLADLGALGSTDFEIADSATSAVGAALLRESLVEPFQEIASSLNRRGLMPVVRYAYRSPELQSQLLRSPLVIDQVIDRVIWEYGPEAVTPANAYDRLVVLCANTFATGTHLAGTALDVSVRAIDGPEIDVGGPYLVMSEVTPMDSPFVSAAARTNRAAMSEVFAEQGFYAYPFEFWHFSRDDVYGVSLGRSRGPVRFGPVHVDVATGQPTAVARPTAELIQRDELETLLAARLAQRESARGPG